MIKNYFSVNKIFNLLNDNWGGNRAKEWLQNNGIQRQDYRNGELNGNACKKILKKLRNLKSQVPKRLWKYIFALEDFEKVRQSCFGHELKPRFKRDIENFRKSYEKLGVDMTNKIHILVHHVPQFCDEMQVGLGFFSEQAR